MREVPAYTIVSPVLWIGFLIGVVILLLLDLSLFHSKSHKVGTRQAIVESISWIAVALAFNLGFYFLYGAELGVQFLTGYVVEKSLSMDNLFVILLIFESLKIKHEYRFKVLFYGVLGAILMRGSLILIGAKVADLFHWVFYIFGVILIVTAIKFLRESDQEVDVKESKLIRLISRFVPMVKHDGGGKFLIHEQGKRKATQLMSALLLIESMDLIFALDSVPAVLAVTHDAFVAFASNILAILGLRALYFVIADWISRLRYLKPGLAAILTFIGLKMLIEDFVQIPSWVSLLVILGVLVTAALTSWYAGRIEQKS